MTITSSPVGPAGRPLDLKRTHAALYTAADTPCLVDVPELSYLAVDGTGGPDAPAYADAVAALFGVSYALRALLRPDGGPGHVVMPLEGLWWTPDPAAFRSTPRTGWHWTALVLQPPQVDPALVRTAVDAVARKRGGPAPQTLAGLELRRLAEGRCAQVMHHGPYADEAPTIDTLHAFVDRSGLALRGHHHEIYLTDPRRCRPERMRTVLRQPVVQRARGPWSWLGSGPCPSSTS